MKPIFTKRTPIAKSLWLCLCLLFTVPVLAQTPTVLTFKATTVSSTEIPEGSANFTITALLYGAVNANGTNCTVSFEYGNSTSYGNSYPASPETVTGSVLTGVNRMVTLNYTATGSQERVIHYRLKVVNENGTYYSRDFVATPIDPSRNIKILAACSDDATMANFEMLNRNLFDIIVDYDGGPSFKGSRTMGPHVPNQIFIPKGSICAFYYRTRLFRQLLTNDQLCSETQLLKQKIVMTATGEIASDKMMYRIENTNSSSVNIEITCGSAIYPYTIAPQSVAYFVGPRWAEAQISISAEPFAVSSPSPDYIYEGMAWLSVTPLSTTATTADFELYNRDDAAHTFVLRNNGGTENSYTLAAYESRTITLANENWDVYTTVWDPTGMVYNNIYTGPTFGDAAYCYNGLLKVATAIPGSSLTASVAPASIASSTSLTLNGVISNSAFANTAVDYHFKYGTDPGDLNQTTPVQQISIAANQFANVETTITGLTPGTNYWVKLVAETIESPAKQVYLPALLEEPGNALSFNGINNNVTIPDNDATISTAVTLETWVLWQPNTNTDVQFICGKGLEQMELHTGAGANGLRFIPTTGVYLDVANVLTVGHWTHVACVYDAANSKEEMYINGNEVTLTNNGSNPVGTALQNTATSFCLGSRSNGSYFLKGSLDEFRVWNRALTQAEIRQNFMTAINPALQNGLVSYYNFNSGNAAGNNSGSTTLYDFTNNFIGALNNFTLTGATSNWVESFAMVVPVAIRQVVLLQQVLKPTGQPQWLEQLTTTCSKWPPIPVLSICLAVTTL
jgi:hypothetical protein